MSDATVQPDAPAFPRMRGVGADGFVNLDVACRTCGYDLRALSVEAKCPECGTDVTTSLRSEELRDADPQWVRRLSLGAQCIGLTLIGHLSAACLVRGISYRVSLTGRLIDIAFVLPWFAGVWLLTRPDPSGRGERQYGSWRRAWFYSASAVAIIDCVELLMALRGTMNVEPLQGLQALSYGAVALIGLQYLARIASRLADGVLPLYAKALSISFAVCYAGVASALVSNMMRVRPNQITLWMGLAGVLLYVATQLFYLGFLARLADRLRRHALVAEENK